MYGEHQFLRTGTRHIFSCCIADFGRVRKRGLSCGTGFHSIESRARLWKRLNRFSGPATSPALRVEWELSCQISWTQVVSGDIPVSTITRRVWEVWHRATIHLIWVERCGEVHGARPRCAERLLSTISKKGKGARALLCL